MEIFYRRDVHRKKRGVISSFLLKYSFSRPIVFLLLFVDLFAWSCFFGGFVLVCVCACLLLWVFCGLFFVNFYIHKKAY